MKQEIKTTVQAFIDSVGINAYTRRREVVYSRFIVFNFLRKYGISTTEIGRLFDASGRKGKLDHSTVIHGLKEYDVLKRGNYNDFNSVRHSLENELESLIGHKKASFQVMQEPIALMNISIELAKLYANPSI